ncbi:MAG: DUF1847 domain-containing protein [Bacillota bacterium]|nr:hypothetical protein [Bacillota bacterium]HWR55209.1 DUF1847 domain-containing protein [Negativicutes bacterium]
MAENKPRDFTCTDCGILGCYRRDKELPSTCLTKRYGAENERVLNLYRDGGQTAQIARAAAEIEGQYYGKLTRVEEIIAFAKKIGARKIGIATCIGLIEEAKTFMRVLQAKGLEGYSVLCKVGAVDKTEIGIPPELKVRSDCHEAICNPVLQADILNAQNTELNVIIGLCVGHDALFIKYSQAPVTTLITKDRLLGHNPAAALYTSGFYYKRLLEKGE